MREELKVDGIVCDYLGWTDFEKICRDWLKGSSTRHIVTLNPEMILKAREDEKFRQAVSDADLRVPDGAGLIWARWYMRSNFWSLLPSLMSFPFVEVERIAGVEAVVKLAKWAHEAGESIGLMGGTKQDVAKTEAKLKKIVPDLVVHKFVDDDLEEINRQNPGVLLVAYGAPKQARWIYENKQKMAGVKIAMGVGGAFAILGETRARAPKWLRKLNAEWLWRLILEPARYKRIWNAVVRFPRLIRDQKLKRPREIF
jgi:N-acetylglucosaminyldiphosphoundecaprenol N-acetyl-beta-D-mannosaminyltransferase